MSALETEVKVLNDSNETILGMDAYLETIKNNYIARNIYSDISEERQAHITKMQEEWVASLGYKVSSKYIKVFVNGSVHSFVIIGKDTKFKIGDILKAASWNTPARNFARGNVLVPSSYEQVSWTGA